MSIAKQEIKTLAEAMKKTKNCRLLQRYQTIKLYKDTKYVKLQKLLKEHRKQ